MTSFARWLSAVLLAFCLVGITVRGQDAAPAEGKIKGQPVKRDNGHWMGIDVSSGSFVVRFYDAKKKLETTEIAKAVLWWPVHYQPNAERDFLTPNSDGALTSEKPVKEPHTFVLHVELFTDAQTDPVEQYVVDFQG